MEIPAGGMWKVRDLSTGDVEAIVRYADNPLVAAHMCDRFPNPYRVDDALRYIDSVLSGSPITQFAIASPDELVGGIGLTIREDVYRRSAELGYWLGEPFWGRGIATAAVRAVSQYGFEHLGLFRIQAGVYAPNVASARVLEKAGFRQEGRLRSAICKNGRILDELVFGRVRGD